MKRALRVLKGALVRRRLKKEEVPFYQKPGFLPMEIEFILRFFEKRGRQPESPWRLNLDTRAALDRDLTEGEARLLAERSFERQVWNGGQIEKNKPCAFLKYMEGRF